MIYRGDDFYEMEFDSGSNDIWCGECINKCLNDANLTGDERINEANVFRMLTDSATIAYQCGSCNKQNDAYENLGEEDEIS